VLAETKEDAFADLLRSAQSFSDTALPAAQAGRLTSPVPADKRDANIVTAYDADEAGDTPLLVMEYVEGVSLADELRSGGPLPVTEACDAIRQAALGLQHAHEKGLVHRDLKPQNLMPTPDGTIKILDFGLAVLQDADASQGSLTGHETRAARCRPHNLASLSPTGARRR
jgi:serine/threonine protein kinase